MASDARSARTCAIFVARQPSSGQPSGSQTNPYVPKNQLEARSLPYNSYFKNPDSGEIGQKLPATQQPATQPPAGQKTSDVDYSDQGQDQSGSAGIPPPTQVQPNQLASLVPPVGQPGVRPDMNTGVGLDQTAGAAPQDMGSQSLADAITKARLVNNFQGMA